MAVALNRWRPLPSISEVWFCRPPWVSAGFHPALRPSVPAVRDVKERVEIEAEHFALHYIRPPVFGKVHRELNFFLRVYMSAHPDQFLTSFVFTYFYTAGMNFGTYLLPNVVTRLIFAGRGETR